jgi:lipopolysaccharide export system protein LptA
MKKINWAFSMLFVCFSCLAQNSDFDAPINVASEHNEASLKDQTIRYWGNVVVQQGSLQIKAEELTLDRSGGKGKEIIIAKGKPAIYSQLLDDNKPIEAKAYEIRYQMEQKVLILNTKAMISQNGSEVRAGRIQYDMTNQKLNADRGDSGEAPTTVFTSEEKSQ